MTAETRDPVRTGGCQCGAVRYALYGMPEGANICHCRMCQKAVGGPFAALATVPLADFAWTRGTTGTFRSSSIAERDFCRACGTPLAFRFVDHRDGIDITIGSLDRPDLVPPASQYGLESRLPWFASMADLPGRTTSEGMDPGRVRRMVNYQHPDHDTDADWRPPVDR